MLPDPALLLAIAATAAIVLVLTTRRTFRYENCSVVMYSSRLKRWSKRERLQPLGLRDGIHLYRDQKGRIWRIQPATFEKLLSSERYWRLTLSLRLCYPVVSPGDKIA
jgi:hypothetical protein